MGTDVSQANDNMEFSPSKADDIYFIRAGNEHYKGVEAFIFGG